MSKKIISVFGCSTDEREVDLVTETIQSQWLGLEIKYLISRKPLS